MKRIAQVAAVLAIAFLAAQPALASLPCIVGSAAGCVSGCPMAMSEKASDCSMAGPMIATGCSQNCCANGGLQAFAPLAAPSKLRVGARATWLTQPEIVSQVGLASGFQTTIEGRGAPPPPVIFNQVLRI